MKEYYISGLTKIPEVEEIYQIFVDNGFYDDKGKIKELIIKQLTEKAEQLMFD